MRLTPKVIAQIRKNFNVVKHLGGLDLEPIFDENEAVQIVLDKPPPNAGNPVMIASMFHDEDEDPNPTIEAKHAKAYAALFVDLFNLLPELLE